MKIILFFAVFFCSVHLTGQNFTDHVSLKLGYSQSGQSPSVFRIEQITSWNNNIHSIYIGINFRKMYSDNWGYSISAQLCEKGYQIHYTFLGQSQNTDTRYRYTLNYFEAPVFLTRRIKKMEFSFGIIASILLQSDFYFYETEWYPTYLYQNYRYAVPDPMSYKRYDIGIGFGVSRSLNNHFALEFNFQRGLINVNKWNLGEIRFQETFLVGFRYYFLRSSRYLIDVRD